MNKDKKRHDIEDLKKLMIFLRDPHQGCPWDVEQTFETIKSHTIEEAYEVADAIERNDMDDLKDELGDLLLQIIFHSQMANEQQSFSFDDVVDHVTKKMIFRHPHVFGDKKAENADEVINQIWEDQKAKEKKSENKANYLDGLTMNLPSLLLANKIQKKVYKVGFSYPDIDSVLDKLEEEIKEFRSAIDLKDDINAFEEVGDLLFCASLAAYHQGFDAEEALRKANKKFIKRFHLLENFLTKKEVSLKDATLEEMEAAWQAIKS